VPYIPAPHFASRAWAWWSGTPLPSKASRLKFMRAVCLALTHVVVTSVTLCGKNFPVDRIMVRYFKPLYSSTQQRRT